MLNAITTLMITGAIVSIGDEQRSAPVAFFGALDGSHLIATTISHATVLSFKEHTQCNVDSVISKVVQVNVTEMHSTKLLY